MSEKTAWVAGGGTGIGLGIARSLADAGYRVYISGRRESVLNDAAKAYKPGPSGGELVAARADVTKESELEAVADRILGERASIDVVAISSGVNVPHRTITDTTPDEWRQIVDVNATGTFLMIKAVLPQMKKQGGGLIVNISSIAGLRALGMAGVAYSASKFASRALGVYAVNEFDQYGIRVTTIFPGEVNTPLLDQRAQPPGPEKRVQMVQPEDVGAVVALIAALPATTEVSEITIKPRYQGLV